MGTARLVIHKKNLKINNENIYVVIFHSAGYKRFRKITEFQYKGFDGVILEYEITH